VAEERHRVAGGDASGEMHDVRDLEPLAEVEHRLAISDVERLDPHTAEEERGHVGATMPGDHDLLAEVGEGRGGVGPDHPEAARDEDHCCTS
jgi:hypothetical protein